MLAKLDLFCLFSELFLLNSLLIITVFGVLVSSSKYYGCPTLNLTIGKLDCSPLIELVKHMPKSVSSFFIKQ